MLFRVQLILDGGPNETLKESEYLMLDSVSLDDSMENVILESTVGPATCMNIK